MSKSKVYLVGAGPGDPGLITVKGLGVLRQADVVIYDYLVDERLLDFAKEDAELICCDLLGKSRHLDGFLSAQEKINNLLVKKAKEGKKVVRLKSGDPAIFSRLSQELAALSREKIEFEIVPGVSASSAASCLTGVPLTDRRFASSVVFVSGHQSNSAIAPSTSLRGNSEHNRTIDWKSVARCGTIVLYMAVENIRSITKELILAGKPANTLSLAIANVSKITQKGVKVKLSELPEAVKKERIKPPAIFIIGEVAKLEGKFNWLRKNRRILFTGLSPERYFLKGEHFHLPLVKIVPLQDYKILDGYLKNIRIYDWIIFGSRYGVEYFFKRLKKAGFDTRQLSGIKIAGIGDSTRNRLLDFGVIADLVPKKESSLGLIAEFKRLGISGKNIFLPRSDISDKGLQSGLEKLGAQVSSCFAYRNIRRQDLPDLDLGAFDEIMFCSPSGVRSFLKRYRAVPKGIKISCIGEVTKNEARKWGLLN